MPAGYLTNPLFFIANTLVGAYIFILILRVLLQYSQADSNNPISKMVIKFTHAPLRVLQPIFPTIKNVSLSAIVLMLILQFGLGLLMTLGQGSIPVFALLVWSLAEVITSIINVMIFSIFITVILHWVGPSTYNPVVAMLHKMTEPIMRPFQRIIPPMGGIDLSPMVALLALQVLKMLLIPPLHSLM